MNPDLDPCLRLIDQDPDPEGLKTYRSSGFGSGSATLLNIYKTLNCRFLIVEITGIVPSTGVALALQQHTLTAAGFLQPCHVCLYLTPSLPSSFFYWVNSDRLYFKGGAQRFSFDFYFWIIPVMWSRISIIFGNLDPHPDPLSHQKTIQISIRIRIKWKSGSASASNENPDPHQSDKLVAEPDPDPLQFSDDKPKCMEYEPIWALLQGFDWAFIWKLL